MKWIVIHNDHENGRDSDYSYTSALTDKDFYVLIKPSKFHSGRECFNPSTDIKAAWDVMKKMRNETFYVREKFMENLQMVVSRRTCPETDWLIMWHGVMWHMEPIDICKAGLLAMID
jgi:hypothetical protein